MTKPKAASFAIAMVLMAGACAASPEANIGDEPDGSLGGSSGAAGTGGAGGSGAGGFGGSDNALIAHVEAPPSNMAVELVTLGCSGECRQVLAVASGGNGPYTFMWNDGITTAARELCAVDDTTFSVTVNDTPIDDLEFHYEGQTATASVIAQVLECPTDEPTWAPCLANPSLEGTPGGSAFNPWDAAPWIQCANPFGAATYIINETVAYDPPPPRATDGQTYAAIHLSANDSTALPGGLGQPLCSSAGAPSLDGEPISFTFDAMVYVDANGTSPANNVRLQIFGGANACAAVLTTPHPAPLWTSPPLTTTWTSYCATLDPDASTASLTFFGEGDANALLDTSTLLLDHIVPVATCP